MNGEWGKSSTEVALAGIFREGSMKEQPWNGENDRREPPTQR